MRLIDADALIEKEERYELDHYIGGERCYQMVVPSWVIVEAPTIDAVEVVRCKDCTGCRFVGTYDTEFPCANCARKTKDYYEPQTERSE